VPEQEHAPRRAVSVDVWAWTPSEPSRLLIDAYEQSRIRAFIDATG
jgi:hypothetical protein